MGSQDGSSKQLVLPPAEGKSLLDASGTSEGLGRQGNTCKSMEKLRSLRAKLQKELAAAVHERQSLANEEQLLPLSLVEEQRDHRGKKGKHQDAKPKPTAKGNAKQRDIDLLFEAQEKEKKVLELHNQRLKQLIDLRQQSSRRSESRVEKRIGQLKAALDKTALAEGEGPTIDRLREMNKLLQEKVRKLQATIENQAEVEKMNLVRQYRVRMHELKKELDEEQQLNYTGAQEWIDKNNHLKDDLDDATETLDKVTDSNARLRNENKELKQKFRQQEDERSAVINHITSVKKENDRLRAHVESLEEELSQLAKKAEAQGVGSNTGVVNQSSMSRISMNRPSQKSNEYAVKYLEMINKVKRQLEQERRTLKQVRSAHIELLQERTEMEVFLRQCIQDVRKEIVKNSHSTPHTTTASDYTATDRQARYNLLTSKERVLTVLYAQTFPFKMPQDSIPFDTDTSALPPPSVMSSSAEYDMDTLWKKWKTWTERSI
eukprot:TRINITY_DN15675_c0_g1_i1.p1 TRINITY_DN15675_c0_g1~~TRINITY_DN15675_c0_g1_i1.p1  ORF type:complete len:490 (+),score=93.40 TRINITY_DN15675_c0_g1_i1:32-1501(+)